MWVHIWNLNLTRTEYGGNTAHVMLNNTADKSINVII